MNIAGMGPSVVEKLFKADADFFSESSFLSISSKCVSSTSDNASLFDIPKSIE